MSLYGVGLNVNIERIFISLQFYITQAKGELNIRNLFSNFDQFTRNNLITPPLFEKALNQFGFFVSKVDLQTLVKYLSNQDGLVDLNIFKRDIIKKISPRRQQLILKVWEKLAAGRQFILVEDIVNNINVSSIPSIQQKKKTKDEVINNIIYNFNFNQNNEISQQEFLKYYEELSIGLPSDDQFSIFIHQLWNVKEDNESQIQNQEIQSVVKEVRYKLIQKSHSQNEEYLLRKIYGDFDSHRSGTISLNELNAIFLKLDVPISKKHLQLFFDKFDTNKTGHAEFDEILNFILYDPYK